MTDESAESTGDVWKPSGLRVAVHEVGHAAVRYLLTGRLSAIYVFVENGEYSGQAPAMDDQDAADPAMWQVGAAFFYGGWAAVHLAIEAGLLPREPTSVEATPGDHGFLGICPADEALVSFSAAKANPANPAASIQQAKEAALDALRDRLYTILELAPLLVDQGFLDEDAQREAFGPRGEADETSAADE